MDVLCFAFCELFSGSLEWICYGLKEIHLGSHWHCTVYQIPLFATIQSYNWSMTQTSKNTYTQSDKITILLLSLDNSKFMLQCTERVGRPGHLDYTESHYLILSEWKWNILHGTLHAFFCTSLH